MEKLSDDLYDMLVSAQYRGVEALVLAWSEKTETPTLPVDIHHLEASLVVIPSTDDDLSSNCIGRIRLPWTVPSEVTIQWIDTAIVVRKNGTWMVLPVEMCDMEDEPPEDDLDEEWVYPTLSSYQLPNWSVHDLRQALTASKWVYRTSGLGVFLSGAIDLDTK